MKTLSSLLAALAIILQLTMPAPASAQTFHPTQTAWPDLTTGGVAFDATHLVFMSGQSSATTGGSNNYQLGITYWGSGPWTGTQCRFLLTNFYVNGGPAPEKLATNTNLYIDWATVTTGATSGSSYPLTFNGALHRAVEPGGFVWSDPVAGFTAAPNTDYFVRHEVHVAGGEKYPTGYQPSLYGNDAGEASLSKGVDQPTLRLSGAFPGAGKSNALRYGPSAMVCSGWDGVTPAALINGTSRAWGQGDYAYRLASRENAGAIARGLDSTTGGRWTYGNWSNQGAYSLYGSLAYGGNFNLRLRTLLALPMKPFNRIFTDNAVNDINGTSTPITTLAQMQAVQLGFWGFLHTLAPNAPIYQTFGEPWASTTLNNTLWATVADQVPNATATYPSGLQFTFDAWLSANSGLPSYVTPVDLSAAFQVSGQPDHWPIPSTQASGTITSGSGASWVLNLSSIPTAGDCVVLSYGTANAENMFVDLATGSAGALTLNTIGNTSKTHVAGDQVRGCVVHDGVHPSTTLATSGGAIIGADKVSGTIH